jgi:hypothetical protein
MLNALIKALNYDCAGGTTGEGSGGSDNNGSIDDKNGTNDGVAASRSSALAGFGSIGGSIPLNDGCCKSKQQRCIAIAWKLSTYSAVSTKQ